MSQAINIPTPVDSRDRMGIMLFFAIMLHALFILGISFDLWDVNLEDTPLEALEIILVHHRSDKAPEDADYLAQTNQEGGGAREDKVRPQSPLSSPKILPEEGNAPLSQPASTPAPSRPQKQEVLVRERAEKTVITEIQENHQPLDAKGATALELMQQSREIARLSAEINAALETQSHRPRHKHINARTREYQYASYMEAWRRKVERIGNLNYPDEARNRGLTGSLVLDVAINPDGTILEIKLLRSSGQQVLDAAAERIVRLASPYAPLPDNIRKETDILHIIRTWQFMDDNRLFSKP